MSALTPASDARPADWIVEALQTFGKSPLSLVPAGFPSYVRIFHPAYKFVTSAVQPRESVRWADIAAAKGTRAHPAMQLAAIAQTWKAHNQSVEGVFDVPPTLGTLPDEIAPLLAGLLGKYTATPERCWFAVWNGFGGDRTYGRNAPTFIVPAREYFLFTGTIDAITNNALGGIGWQSANIWWPDDHAWCVATEIDLQDTYIACAPPCRDELLAAPGIEAMEVEAGAGISFQSDSINPIPPYGT